MKKSILAIPLCAASVLTLLAAAAGGDASDPLISLSYLNSTYTSTVEARVAQKLDESDQALLSTAGAASSGGVSAGSSYAETWTEQRLTEGDQLTGATGLSVMALAGSVRVTFSAGAVVDISTGAAVPSGTALAADHRYLVAEDTTAAFTVTSPTAVVDFQGYYGLSLSGATDYNAIAGALKTMHLFRGSLTAYGGGYDLEKAPTRMQALIMFLRILGEEDDALAWTGTTPFTDVTAGSDSAKYVGYAYEKGYTNGYTATQWRPAQTVNIYQYTEFVLRALGYSSAANTDLSATLDRAVDSGVLTAAETAAMKDVAFLRAQLVYISYYALDATVSGSDATLGDTLMAKGVFNFTEYTAARAQVTGQRIG